MAASSYDYAVIRVTPRVEREEFLNVGVVLFCRTQRFLAARICLDETRLRMLAPEADVQLITAHLTTIPDICAGKGPIGELGQAEAFHWLVAPHSTIIQASPVHSGLCDDPEEALERLAKAVGIGDC